MISHWILLPRTPVTMATVWKEEIVNDTAKITGSGMALLHLVVGLAIVIIIILILHLSVCESGRSREAIRPELKTFLFLHRWT